MRQARCRIMATLGAGLVLAACGPGEREGDTAIAGEILPVPEGSAEAAQAPPGQPLAFITEAERGRYLLGRALFERLATPEEGLGPLFNASRCSDCHSEPAVGGTSLRLVTKASRFAVGQCSELEHQGGGNIQQQATPALQALGVMAEPMPADATEEAVFLAPPLFGLGLLESVSETDIVALADPTDSDGDGVSGRAHQRPDGQLGRFGWKADSPSIPHFVDTAIRFEIGLSTPDFPQEEGVNAAPLPDGVDPTPEPEIDANGVSLLAEYVRFLAAPAPASDDEVTAPRATIDEGSGIFDEIGCASCHVPALRTGPDVPGIPAGLTIQPYTDLLLHDMGEELAGTCGGVAGPTEYRTTPLWGLRHRPTYIHDGRAGSIEEAILLHGGEGEGARVRFAELSPERRSALLAFLLSL